MDTRSTDLDLYTADDDLEFEQLDDAVALNTWSTTSTASSGSCPVSTALTAMTANCAS